ncbi:MAG: MgtC/SapB family protein [Vicinamibacterales bacterium]
MPAEAELQHLLALPLAALLGAALAFRPRRRGTPPRVPAVIQTQVILAVVGALVMLVVGASMARAFGIVGAASLIRYRAKISDPKDAGVMLCALGVGLAAGVGLYLLATAATIFLLAVLYAVESLERPTFTLFELTVGAKAMAAVRPELEHLLSRHHARAELRHLGPDEVTYTVRLPVSTRLDSLSDRIVKLDPNAGLTVEWDEKKVRA